MAHTSNRSTFFYEFSGMILIIILGSVLHFTFEWSGSQPIIGLFSAINESVWEHLKLAFWPALLFALIEYPILKKVVNNFAFAKTIGVYLMVIIIPIIFYSYTAVTGKSIFVIDISSFIVAVIVGQLSSYKLLKYRKLAGNFNKVSLIALVLLGLAFVLFTFYPPQLQIFKDPVTGKYGLPQARAGLSLNSLSTLPLGSMACQVAILADHFTDNVHKSCESRGTTRLCKPI